jgi:hypothetical protein
MMMKTTPASPLKVAQTEFLFELLVIRSIIQRCLAKRTRSPSFVSLGNVESQYLVGSASPRGYSIKSHSSGCGSLRQ